VLVMLTPEAIEPLHGLADAGSAAARMFGWAWITPLIVLLFVLTSIGTWGGMGAAVSRMPYAAGVGAPRTRYRSFGGSSTASLHAKTFGVDDSRIFVGSFNVDRRSIDINTELGLVIDSPRLAGEVSTAMDRAKLRSAYEVSFTENGHSLQWRERTEQGDVIYTHEPKTGFFKRMFVKFMSWLPIDWLL